MKKKILYSLIKLPICGEITQIHVVNDTTRAAIDDMVSAAIDKDSRPYEISAALAAVQVDKPSE